MVVGLGDTIEAVIDTDKRGIEESIVTTSNLYDLVEKVNRGRNASGGRRVTWQNRNSFDSQWSLPVPSSSSWAF